MPDPAKDAAKGPVMGRAIVAPGRTVSVPTEEKRVAAYTPDNKPIHRLVEVTYRPGQEVSLPVDEIAYLRRTGFLVDPDAILVGTRIGANPER